MPNLDENTNEWTEQFELMTVEQTKPNFQGPAINEKDHESILFLNYLLRYLQKID